MIIARNQNAMSVFESNRMTTMSFPTPIQYLIKENGERTGVVLRWEDYQRLRATFHTTMATATDPDILPGLNPAELHTLAAVALGTTSQARLAELLERNREHTLTSAESQELDQLLADVDALNILKARAQYTLQHLSTERTPQG